MKAKDIASGSGVRYNGIDATLFHLPSRNELRLLAWDKENNSNGFSWARNNDASVSQLDPKWKHCWWIIDQAELELIQPPPKPKTTATKTTSKIMQLSEVKSGTRITIPLDTTGYPCSPYNLNAAASKITGTLFRSETVDYPTIAWKAEEKPPTRSWDIASKPGIESYGIPAGFNRGFYLGYPNLEVEVEVTKSAKANEPNFGFLLSCIGAGALMTGLSKVSTTSATSTKQLPERTNQ